MVPTTIATTVVTSAQKERNTVRRTVHVHKELPKPGHCFHWANGCDLEAGRGHPSCTHENRHDKEAYRLWQELMMHFLKDDTKWKTPVSADYPPPPNPLEVLKKNCSHRRSVPKVMAVGNPQSLVNGPFYFSVTGVRRKCILTT